MNQSVKYIFMVTCTRENAVQDAIQQKPDGPDMRRYFVGYSCADEVESIHEFLRYLAYVLDLLES
jgi:hypothetical protein